MSCRLLALLVVGLLVCVAAPAAAGVGTARAGTDLAAVAVGGCRSLALVGGEAPGGFGKATPVDGATGQPISLSLLWGAAVGAASYEYCVDASDDDACAGWVDVGTATGAAVSGLSSDTVYFWQVRASNAFGTTYADGGAFGDFATLVPGTIAAWGSDDYGQVSNTPAGTGFVAVAAGRYHSLALRADGSLVSWGYDGDTEVSGTPAGTGFVAVAAGGYHNVAVRADGSLVAWGYDSNTQVSGTPAGTGFLAVAAGGYHSMALRADGSLASWGFDGDGQVSGTPAGTDFVAVAAGWYHSVALRADGSLVAWGRNLDGQLSGTPAGTGFVAVAAGGYHSVALRADGSLASWGYDGDGQVSGTPAGGGFVAVAAGDHSLALRADGSLASWGNNAGGQVSGTPAGTGFVAVAAGEQHSLALVTLLEATFRSMGAYDGWVLERDEDSGKGSDTLEAAAATARLGDAEADRQYRSILHFDTGTLPDDAVVVGVTIRVRRQGITGFNPFTTHGLLKVDMQSGAYHGILALEKYDFHAVGSRGNVGRFIMTPTDRWYRAPLREPSWPLINLTGTTQFRLRFEVDDNDDLGADYLSFYTGNTPTEADRPELVITYYLP